MDLGRGTTTTSPGPEGERGHQDRTGAEAPRPGERLLYALGQLYRLYRGGELDALPELFDMWDLAGVIGVRTDVEFIREDRDSAHWHFADEVLVMDFEAEFPWRLLTLREWAAELDADPKSGH